MKMLFALANFMLKRKTANALPHTGAISKMATPFNKVTQISMTSQVICSKAQM